MDRLQIEDSILWSIRKLTNEPNLSPRQWEIIRDHIGYCFVAGYEEGWRQRSAGHSLKPVRIKNKRTGRTINTHSDAHHAFKALGGGSISNFYKAIQGKNKKNYSKHSTFKGYIIEYIED